MRAHYPTHLARRHPTPHLPMQIAAPMMHHRVDPRKRKRTLDILDDAIEEEEPLNMAAVAAAAAANALSQPVRNPLQRAGDAQIVSVPPEMDAGLQPQMAQSWLRWMQQMYQAHRAQLNARRVAFTEKTTFEMLQEHVRKRHSITIDDDTLVSGLSMELDRVNDRADIVKIFQRDWKTYRQIIFANTLVYKHQVESLHPGSFNRFMRHHATFGNIFDPVTNTWWDKANVMTLRLDLEAIDIHHLDNPIADDLQMMRRHAEIARQAEDTYWTHGTFQQDLRAAIFSTVHTNWVKIPDLVREEWKSHMAMHISSIHQSTASAVRQVTTDRDTYLTQPDVNHRRIKQSILRDLRVWQNAILISQDHPEDIEAKLRVELSDAEAASMDRRRELARLESPDNLTKVKQLSNAICMLEWTRLAEANTRKLVALFNTMPRVFFELSGFDDLGDNKASEMLIALRDRWTQNLSQIIEQKRHIEQDAQFLMDDANEIRIHIYSAAHRMDIDLAKLQNHEQLHSVFDRRNKEGNRPSGNDAFTLLTEEVDSIIKAIENGHIHINMSTTQLLSQKEARLITQGMKERDEPRVSLTRMLDRMGRAASKLEDFACNSQPRQKRRRVVQILGEEADIETTQASPRLHFDTPNNNIMLLPKFRQDLEGFIDGTYARLNACTLQYKGTSRPSVTDKSTIADAWTIVGNLVRVESWVFFASQE